MLSATGITAALAILALSVSVVNTDRAPLNAGTSAMHTVNADGSGDYATIQAAVDAAADGDTILVGPGAYTEAIVIDKDITLTGVGPREDVVITAPDDGPSHETGFVWMPSAPYALLFMDSDGMLGNLTLMGERARLFVDGGSPLVEGLRLEEVGFAYEGTAKVGAVVFTGGASPEFRENLFVNAGDLDAFEDSDPIIERNVFDGSGGIAGDFGTEAEIRENVIGGSGFYGITFLGATTATIEDNQIGGKKKGINVGDGTSIPLGLDGPRFAPVIEGNTITGSTEIGIHLTQGGNPSVIDNTITDGQTGIRLHSSDATLIGNEVSGHELGITVFRGEPTLEGNQVAGNHTGLSIAGSASVTLTDNVICDNETNLSVEGDADLAESGNEICEDTTTE